MSTSKSNASASTDPLARRESLISELEKAAKAAQGSLQQVLHKMAVLIGGTRSGATISADGCQEIKDAFLRFSEDPSAPRTPPILLEAMEWVMSFMAISAPPPAAAAPGARAPAVSAASAAKRGLKGNDSFESGGAQPSRAPPARALTGDVPVSPAQPDAAKGQKEQLESFKTWMKNPGLGKLKG